MYHFYMARRWDGVGTAIQIGKTPRTGICILPGYSGMSGYCYLVYPDPLTGSVLIADYVIWENALSYVIRGRLPGLWHMCHTKPLTHGDTFSGTVGTELEGKTFLYLNSGSTGGLGAIVLETSNTWYT